MSEYPNVGAGPGQPTGRTGQQSEGTAAQAKAAAGEVAGTAKDQARAVTGQAREQTRNMMGTLREKATGEAESQTKRAAGNLRQWADDLSDMASQARPDSPVRGLVSQAADGGRRLADALEQQGLSGMVDKVQDFGRRHPGAFLATAAAAGLAVGRTAKAGMKGAKAQPSAGGAQDTGADSYQGRERTEGQGGYEGYEGERPVAGTGPAPYGTPEARPMPPESPSMPPSAGREAPPPGYGETGARRYPEVS